MSARALQSVRVNGDGSCSSMGTVPIDNKRKEQSVNENRPC